MSPLSNKCDALLFDLLYSFISHIPLNLGKKLNEWAYLEQNTNITQEEAHKTQALNNYAKVLK